MQTFHVRELPMFNIEDHGFRMVLCDLIPQLLARAGHVHGKMRVKSADQRADQSRILLQDYTGVPAAVDLAYRITLTRPPSSSERARALAFLDGEPARLKDFAWLLFNLDEFLFVR